MPRKQQQSYVPPNTCDGEYRNDSGELVRCGNLVESRKPSETGTHWCSRPACQAAKQRYYRARRKAEADQGVANVIHELVRDLIALPRTRCPQCGLEDALPGWFHRFNKGSSAPCPISGPKGAGLPPGTLDIIHPSRAPRS